VRVVMIGFIRAVRELADSWQLTGQPQAAASPVSSPIGPINRQTCDDPHNRHASHGAVCRDSLRCPACQPRLVA